VSETKFKYEQRLALIQQVARRLEKLDDSRLAEIESSTRPHGAAVADAVPGLSRRNFLRDVLLYTGAGLAVGGAAAVAKDRWDAGQAVVPSPTQLASGPVEVVRAQAEDTAAELTALQQSLSAAEAALAELRPQLSSALTENAGLKNDLGVAQANLLSKQQESDSLRAQVGLIEGQLGKYQRLIELFDSLESIPLESALVNGLASSAVGFGAALGLAPLVTQGLTLARGLFDGFENQFPLFRSGLDWLQGRLDGLQAGIDTVEAAAAKAVDSLDPATSRLTQLINYILDHLPFGIGRSIKEALMPLSDVYHSLPDLILGANSQVVGVLKERFSAGEAGLQKSLLQPVRESAFAPAEQLAAQVEALHRSYVSDLHDPVVGALDQRQAAREEIRAYRAANQM
jgi:hypothetical protein